MHQKRQQYAYKNIQIQQFFKLPVILSMIFFDYHILCMLFI